MLREALTRLFGSRAAWVWVLLEPAFHVAYLMVIFGVIRIQHIGGVESVVWIMVGMLGFLLFRRTATQCQNGIGANRSLFAYRQVLPIDVVMSRGLLEATLMLAVGVLMVSAAALLGYRVVPADPWLVIQALVSLWMLGLGFGLVTSVLAEMLDELNRLASLMMMPLYMISGIMFPLQVVPQPYRGWLMLNPVAHGVEALRLGFAPFYHAVPELSMGYLHLCALALVFLGLALQRRFAQQLSSS